MKIKLISTSLLFVALATPGLSSAALPDSGMEIVAGRTALVVTDPQNDFLSRLVETVQALYPGRQNRCDQPAQSLRARNQRPGTAATQAGHRQGDPGRYVRQSLHRVAYARIARTGF